NQRARDDLDERLLDHLVDGELADDERRELLMQLEKEPDGWRRCALAFLEAQTWRQALAPVACQAWLTSSESASEVSHDPGYRGVDRPRSPSIRSRFWRPVARLAGLAATLA